MDIYLFVNILNIYYHQIIAKLPKSQLRKIIYVHSRCKTHVQKSEHCRILLGPLQETKVKGKKHQVLHFLLFNLFADKHTIVPHNFTTKLSLKYKISPMYQITVEQGKKRAGFRGRQMPSMLFSRF